MKLSGKLMIVACIVGLTGCDKPERCVVPTYPKPSKHVLSSIHSLNDAEVNAWMVKQYKLNQKLKK